MRFILQALPRLALFLFLLQGCAPGSQPTKSNVLSRPSAAGHNAPGDRRMSAGEMRNYPKPEARQPAQRETARTPPHRNRPAVQRPPATPLPTTQETPEENAMNNAAPSSTGFTPQYYRSRADSLQKFVKPVYFRMTDSLVQIMTRTINPKNPAVNASQWYATPNFNLRKPNYVVLHHTAQNSADQTLYTFSISRVQASAHYVVGRDGIVYQLLNDYMRAWHAGTGKWGSNTDVNSSSVGIEIDNNGNEPFSDAQIAALINLLAFLKKEYGIPQSNFIGHSDIAPTRKNDPSKYFPWKRLADAGFGYWYDPGNMKEPPADFNALLAMRVIGYDISNQSAAIEKFKLHFIQSDTSPRLTDWDKKVLYNLYMKY